MARSRQVPSFLRNSLKINNQGSAESATLKVGVFVDILSRSARLGEPLLEHFTGVGRIFGISGHVQNSRSRDSHAVDPQSGGCNRPAKLQVVPNGSHVAQHLT